MKRIFFTLLFIGFALPLSAHEFWLKPAKFVLKKGEGTELSLRVGESFTGDLWKFTGSRVLSFEQCHENQTENITPTFKDGEMQPLNLTFKSAGTHLIALHTSPKFIELDGPKFSEYLKEDGLDDILALREKRGETSKAGRELYRRCAKSLVQVGDVKDETFSRVVNFPIEIIPEANPHALKSGSTLSVKILFNGKPLAGTLVRTWHKVGGKVETASIRAGSDGRASFQCSTTGEWMISLVKMVEADDKTKADYESFWASLTFGFDS